MPSSAKGHTGEWNWIDAYPSPAPLTPVHRLTSNSVITKLRHGGQVQLMCGARRGSIRSWGTCSHTSPPNHAIVSRFPGLDVNAWVVRANPHPSKAESICTVHQDPLLIHHARWGGGGRSKLKSPHHSFWSPTKGLSSHPRRRIHVSGSFLLIRVDYCRTWRRSAIGFLGELREWCRCRVITKNLGGWERMEKIKLKVDKERWCKPLGSQLAVF